MNSVFIIEDDTDIREMESYALKNSGFKVKSFSNGKEFFAECDIEIPELVLLDLMLPGEDGLTLLRKIRQNHIMKDVPVIIVTAKTTELDKVRGLDMGADDYLTKPFGILELVSRVKALLRRSKPLSTENNVFRYGELSLDDDKRTVSSCGNAVDLTFKEYELLKYMLSNHGMVMTREKLLDSVWGFDYVGETRTVDMHIKTLRQKLGPCGRYIITVRNVGYKLGD